MHEVKAIVRSDLAESVIQALQGIHGMPGVIVSTIRAHGRRSAGRAGVGEVFEDVVMAKIEAVVPESLLFEVIETIKKSGRTGRHGDGKVFVSDTQLAFRIRTGDSGPDVL